MICTVGLLLAATVFPRYYTRYLETGDPTIELLGAPPRGIGRVPVTLKFRFTDRGSGLDQVVIRAKQRRINRELVKRKYDGVEVAEEEIEFAGEQSGLESGQVDLEIRAFDRSLWSNRAERRTVLKVDFKLPQVEVVSTQHNGRRGGSQLVLYRAADDDLSLTGVKTHQMTAFGISASGVDKAFAGKDLYAVIYPLALDDNEASANLRVFAEDNVGNAASVKFPNRLAERPRRVVPAAVDEQFLDGEVRELFSQNLEQIRRRILSRGEVFAWESEANAPQRKLERLQLVVRELRAVDDAKIRPELRTNQPRFERFWTEPFLRPHGTITSEFGDTTEYRFNNQPIVSEVNTGYEMRLPAGADVTAVSGGVVVHVDSVGTYGRLIAVDHGFGLITLYSNLEEVKVPRGTVVERGRVIGRAGRTGLARSAGYRLEVRLHGVPVDGREWWDEGWFHAHITEKISEVKRIFGIPVYESLPGF